MEPKIYTEWRMLIGTAIGGPFAAAYYLVQTLRTLGKSQVAVALAVILPLLVFVLNIASAFIPLLQKLPDPFWWLLELGIVYGFVRAYMLTEFLEHIRSMKPVYGWGNTLKVAFTSLFASLLLLAPFFIFDLGVLGSLSTFTYGNAKHEIHYDPANISELEVRRIAASLTNTQFATDEFQTAVEVERSKNAFVISIFFPKVENETRLIESYSLLQKQLQQDYPVERIVLDLVDADSRRSIARLE